MRRPDAATWLGVEVGVRGRVGVEVRVRFGIGVRVGVKVRT